MMNPVDPTTLPGLPAPFWFIEFFKVSGFTLHMVPMHLWYAGVLLAAWLHFRGGEEGRRFASRLMGQMPVLVAFGINFGIVPLLFTQLAYCKAFYPATILMAWPWLAIIALLIPAYYGVYIYSYALRDEAAVISPLKKAAGWCAAVMFIVIGFLFANGFSLMTNVDGWRQLWLKHSVGGAATGTALNLGDPSLWPRWLLMFGLALLTTAAWTVVDAAWFAARENREYKLWAQRFALRLAMVGVVWCVIAGAWYLFGTWSEEVRSTMFGGPLIVLTIVTAVSPAVPLLVMYFKRNGAISRTVAATIGLIQFGVLGLNAASRQIVQNVEIGKLLDVSRQPLAVQWSPLIAFLLVFVAGAVVVGWMIAHVLKVSGKPLA